MVDLVSFELQSRRTGARSVYFTWTIWEQIKSPKNFFRDMLDSRFFTKETGLERLDGIRRCARIFRFIT